MHESGMPEDAARSGGSQWVLSRTDSRTDLTQRVDDVAGQLVVISVVPALHHDDMHAVRHRARQPYSERCGFAARVEQSHLLRGRYMGTDQLGEPALQRGWPRPDLVCVAVF